ncbi:MAG: PD40 domain-containing protein, partial [Solirubrobacterales bacterium]|nr:PD40 domain-containing protein [Solirubrobacterales bacterium]
MRRSSALAVLAAAVLAPAAHAAPGDTLLVSTAPGQAGFLDGRDNRSNVEGGHNVSADGRYVAFASDADALLPAGVGSAWSQVYVRDRQTGETTLVSRLDGPGGAPAPGDCSGSSISADGRRVAFVCRAGLVPEDTNAMQDAYVRDLDAGTTTLVSRQSGLGAVGDGWVSQAVISGNGEYVAFSTDATNLSALDDDGAQDVFRRRLGSGDAVALASVPTGQPGTPGDSDRISISDDGNRVAFAGNATGRHLQVAIDDTNGHRDVFVHQFSPAATTLVSTRDGQAITQLDGSSDFPNLSGDGAYVVFESSATNTGTADADTALDVFRRALGSAQVVLVSQPDGIAGTADGASRVASASDDGSVVAFTTTAANLGDGDADATSDVHVRRIGTGDTEWASRGDGDAGPATGPEGGAYSPSLSGDGTVVAFDAGEGAPLLPGLGADFSRIFVRTLTGSPRRTTLLSQPPGEGGLAGAGGENESWATTGGAISADGRLVAFMSRADGLLAGDDDLVVNGYVRDITTNDLTLVTRADGAAGEPLHADARDLVLSADGRRAAFVTDAALDPADANGKPDVYVRDLAAGTTVLASRGDDGAIGNGFSQLPALDADGSRVAFSSSSSNLADGDDDAQGDVHVRDLAAGRTLLASATPGGADGDGASGQPSISADGTRVAFESRAKDLGDGDADATSDVHVRDLAAATTTLASRADGAGGAKGTGDSHGPSLSADGTRVAFTTQAPLEAADTGASSAYVRDLAAGTTTYVSRESGAGASFASVQRPVLSGDGRTVAFTAGGLLAIDEEASTVITRDLVTGETAREARAPGGALIAAASLTP